MAFSIKNPKTDRLARTVARLTGESLTDAVTESLQRRLDQIKSLQGTSRLADRLDGISKRCAALPDLDTRMPDEILGYDEHGLPH